MKFSVKYSQTTLSFQFITYFYCVRPELITPDLLHICIHEY